MNHSEIIFFNYIKDKPEFIDIIDKSFFSNKSVQVVYDFHKKFWKKFNSLPTKKQVIQVLQSKSTIFNLDGNFNFDLINQIYDVNVNDYDSDWLASNVETWMLSKNLDNSLVDVIQLIQTSTIGPDNIHKIINQVKDIIIKKNNIDLNGDIGSSFFDIDKHQLISKHRFSTGFSFFDDCMGGGLGKGEITVISGPAKGGKSSFLGAVACNVVKSGRNVVVISLEMDEHIYLKRLACSLLNINGLQYEEYLKNKVNLQRKILELKNNSLEIPGELIVKQFIVGSTTIPDIENYINRLQDQKGINIDLVVLDYLNLCNNWRLKNSENMYINVKHICEDFRACCKRTASSGFTATQLNRSGIGNSRLTMTNLSESMGVAHTADSLFGIKSRDILDFKNNQIGLQALALRNAHMPDYTQYFDVDLDRMYISESTRKDNDIDKTENPKHIEKWTEFGSDSSVTNLDMFL